MSDTPPKQSEILKVVNIFRSIAKPTLYDHNKEITWDNTTHKFILK
jgi:hypothetical protein